MQAVETTGGEEARNRIGPALDQDAAETARGERGNDGGGSELAVVRSNRHHFDAGGKLAGRAGGGDHEPAHTVGRQHARGRRQPAIRIHDNACGVRALDAPHGQLWVVSDGRAYADHDRVDQRPQAVQMGEARLAVDVVRVSGGRGDPGVDRLAALADQNEIVDGALA